MNQKKLIPLTQKELSKLRVSQLKKQNGICPILKIPITDDESVFDHKHKLKSQECGGPDGLGCLRGVVHRNANSFEGKLERANRRRIAHVLRHGVGGGNWPTPAPCSVTTYNTRIGDGQ